MPADSRVIADLESSSIEYEEMVCDPALADTAAFCEAYGIPMEKSANAILVASRKPEGHNAMCVVLANDRLDVNGVVRRRLGVRKVSFASADLTRELTAQEIGGVTIFGLPDDLPVWIDSRVLDNDWVIVGAGSRSAKIRLDPNQLIDLDGYEVVDGLARSTLSD
jgi:prolyl-tRNA editing enzyme YbaK/EbsC (Cys-tRNA(Pro) deacylase)